MQGIDWHRVAVKNLYFNRPKSAKSADIKKRPPKNEKNEDDEGGDEKELGVEEDSDSEDENCGGGLDDDQLMPFTQSFIFSLLWALGGYLEDNERSKLEAYLRGQVSISLVCVGNIIDQALKIFQ